MTVMLETETTNTRVYSNYDEVLFMNLADMFEYLRFGDELCVCSHDSDLHGWTGCHGHECACGAYWVDMFEEPEIIDRYGIAGNYGW